MPVFDSIEALTAAAGRSLGATEWQVLSQERIRAFADLTGDHQWIHVDEQRARAEGPFGGTVAHGALTLALVPVFVGQLVQVRGAHIVLNGGLDRVRFRAPVRAGANVRGVVELLSTVELGEGTLVTVRATVEVHGERRPACVADQALVFRD
jgi:acyl dehydratase